MSQVQQPPPPQKKHKKQGTLKSQMVFSRVCFDYIQKENMGLKNWPEILVEVYLETMKHNFFSLLKTNSLYIRLNYETL